MLTPDIYLAQKRLKALQELHEAGEKYRTDNERVDLQEAFIAAAKKARTAGASTEAIKHAMVTIAPRAIHANAAH